MPIDIIYIVVCSNYPTRAHARTHARTHAHARTHVQYKNATYKVTCFRTNTFNILYYIC